MTTADFYDALCARLEDMGHVAEYSRAQAGSFRGWAQVTVDGTPVSVGVTLGSNLMWFVRTPVRPVKGKNTAQLAGITASLVLASLPKAIEAKEREEATQAASQMAQRLSHLGIRVTHYFMSTNIVVWFHDYPFRLQVAEVTEDLIASLKADTDALDEMKRRLVEKYKK